MRQVVLHSDPEDGGWVAEVPSLPGCISQGDTKAEALANIREAIEAWIGTAADLHIDVPAETFDAEVCVIQ